MAHVEGPLGTGCKQQITKGLISFYFRVSANEEQKQNLFKHLQMSLQLFNSWRHLCRTMSGLFRGKAPFYRVWSGPNHFHGDKSPLLFWCMIAKEFKPTAVTVWFSFSGLSEKKTCQLLCQGCPYNICAHDSVTAVFFIQLALKIEKKFL